MKLPLYLLGSLQLIVPADRVPEVLSICLARNLSFSRFQNRADGGVSFRCPLFRAAKLLRELKGRGIEVEVQRGGLPYWLYTHRKRWGLFLGGLCAVALFWLSAHFVWSVRVTGNETLTPTEIKSLLAEEGLEIGSYLPGLHMSEIETKVLIRTDKLAWLSVHMEGTVAVVQVIERKAPPASKTAPANLIAARDGQIEYLELYRGTPVIGVGQAVRAGDLLVSGVRDSQTVGFQVTRAAGKVLARTDREFTVEIPLTYEKKVYTSVKRGEITLRFFKFSMIFFKNTGNEGAPCDIIEMKTSAERFGLSDLPVSVSKQEVRPYRLESAEHTPEEALGLAYTELARSLSALSSDVQILRKEISTTISDDSLVLTCHLYCLEDIAEQIEFEAELS